MKIKSAIYLALFAGLLLPLLLNCKKEAVKVIPTVTISVVTNITAISATCDGEITADGGATIASRGVCWSLTNPTPTIADTKTNITTGSGRFTSSITGLSPGSNYYIRAYATNSVGTAYSGQVIFTTLALAPVLTTSELSAITTSSANGGGNITNDGRAEVIARGVCWSIKENPTIADNKTSNGTGTGSFNSSITGLTPGATYYFRAYATNSAGTGYGNQVTATATAFLPVVTTTSLSAITASTVTSGGNITSDGGATVLARGICWGTAQNPTISNYKTTDGTGSGSYTSSIIGLTPGATYYFRAYATNSAGTGYGSAMSYTTQPVDGGTVTDIEGNVYNTVIIGTQVWMVENLKVTKYRNGDPIPNVTSGTGWGPLKTGVYCDYNDIVSNSITYGKLYNWYAIIDLRNICPIGWHVPSSAEWTTLTTYLGGVYVAGGKLKETGTTHWLSPNTGATNGSGFKALPGGYRMGPGASQIFANMNIWGFWWSTTEIGAYGSVEVPVLTNNESMYNITQGGKSCGYSVRCLKD